MPDEARLKALDNTVSELTKRYGDGTIVRLGDASHLQVEVIPTGSLAIDLAIGVVGIPRGRITEIYAGRKAPARRRSACTSSPKRSVWAACARLWTWSTRSTRCTRSGSALGVDNLYITQPDTGEQALEITDAFGPPAARWMWSCSTAWRRWCRARA